MGGCVPSFGLRRLPVARIGSGRRALRGDLFLPLPGPLLALVLLDGVLKDPEEHRAEFVDGRTQGHDALIVAELVYMGEILGVEELLRGKAAAVEQRVGHAGGRGVLEGHPGVGLAVFLQEGVLDRLEDFLPVQLPVFPGELGRDGGKLQGHAFVRRDKEALRQGFGDGGLVLLPVLP